MIVTEEVLMQPESGLLMPLATLLSRPSPEAVWDLRATLLADGLPGGDPALDLLAAYHRFLVELTSRSTARQFSHLASMLDVGAIAGVAVQNLLEARQGKNWWQRLVVGFMSEGLMVVAARQYVRGWEKEMQATYLDAAWRLYDFYWQLSESSQPDLAPDSRRSLVDRLLQPVRDETAPGSLRAAAALFLFQLLVLVHAQTGGWSLADGRSG
jgi:hypothetical protein